VNENDLHKEHDDIARKRTLTIYPYMDSRQSDKNKMTLSLKRVTT
jgi:hypothetical protein